MTTIAAVRAAGARPATDPVAGLTSAEADRRHLAGEGNTYRSPTSRTYLQIFKDNSYPLINGPLLLVSAALISFGAVTEALMTGVPVFGNIAIGVVQGSRAKRQLDRVALLSQAPATVVRDGTEREVAPAEVVLGDIVVANRGDEIQVDGRIVGPESASLDESVLTGESRAADKSAGDEVRSGSAVLSGVARYEVEAVGADTFANQILSQAKGHRDVRTPLQSDIARAFVAVAVLIGLAAVIVVLSLPAVAGDATHDTVFAAAVLVTLVPQGLALMLTVTYAAAALRISRLGALAQRQSAIEAISRIDTFLTDKTGTLTTQRIAFGAIEPIGAAETGPALDAVVAAIAASTSAPNNTTAALRAAFDGDARPVVGEVPVLVGAPLVGDPLRGRRRRPSGRRRHVRPRRGGGARAVDERDRPRRPGPGGRARRGRPARPRRRPRLRCAASGRRRRRHAARTARAAGAADVRRGAPARGPGHGRRPPRARHRREDRVRRRSRTRSRRSAAGSGSGPTRMPPPAWTSPTSTTTPSPTSRVRTTIFGRVDPHLKARLVTVLKGRGRYVAMTGDGVNDILPVRTADVGVAMQSGSPATRGVADLVLVRDDFSILPEAIRDGQRIVAAMAATLTVLLARTFYVLLIIVGAALLELPFPFTPRQNSILAFITVGVPIVVLALWVRPGPSRAGLLMQTLRISIPLSLGVVAVALPVYVVVAPQRRVGRGRPDDPDDARELPGDRRADADPDRRRRARPDPDAGLGARRRCSSGRWSGLYLVVLSTTPGRSFFQLAPLPWEIVATLLVIAATWTAAVIAIHHTRIVQRGIDVLIGGWRAVRPVQPATQA